MSADFSPKAHAHGFIEHRSIITNADRHVGQRWVLNLDLKDFFETITFPRIYGRLQANPFGYKPKVASIVAQAACINQTLATGGALSPLLSNVICDRLDAELSRLAKSFGCRYTRYADDITFSTGRSRFPPEIAFFSDASSPKTTALGDELSEVIRRNGFAANPVKSRLLGRGTRQEVTGIVVNQKRNVPRSFIRQTRCMLHAWETFGLVNAAAEHFGRWRRESGRLPAFEAKNFEWVVRGKLEFIRSVRGESDPLFAKLAKRFNALTSVAKFKIVPHAPMDVFAEAVWVIEGNRTRAVEEKIETTSFIRDILGRIGLKIVPRIKIQRRIEEDPYIASVFFLDSFGIITCDHCFEEGAQIRRAGMNIGHAVTRLRSSNENDICLVEPIEPLLPGLLPKAKLIPASAEEIAALKVGDEVQIAGFPAHLPENQVSLKTARITRFLEHGFGGRKLKVAERQIVLDGGIIEGNSGGPVLSKGKVIGIAARGVGENNAVGASIVVPITALPTS